MLSILVIVISELNEGRVGGTGEVTCWLNVDRLIVEQEWNWHHKIGVDNLPEAETRFSRTITDGGETTISAMLVP